MAQSQGKQELIANTYYMGKDEYWCYLCAVLSLMV